MFSINPENEQIFESMIQKADTLKLLEHVLRYTELVLYEVKSADSGQCVRRSERNYISWVEEQRRLLFAKNQIQVLFFLGLVYLNVNLFIQLLIFQLLICSRISSTIIIYHNWM